MGIFAQIIRSYGKSIPDGVAVIHGARKLSWSQLSLGMDRLAAALFKLGVAQGTKCGIMLYNSAEFLEANFAIQSLGGIPVPINWRFKSSELEYVLQNSDAELLIFDSQFLNQVRPLKEKLKIKYVCLNPPQPEDWFQDYRELIREAPRTRPKFQIPRDRDAVIIYTGGTTGFPKGVVLSYNHLIRDIELVIQLLIRSLPSWGQDLSSRSEFYRRLFLGMEGLLGVISVIKQEPEFKNKILGMRTWDAELSAIVRNGDLQIFRGIPARPHLVIDYRGPLLSLVSEAFIPVIANRSRIPVMLSLIQALTKLPVSKQASKLRMHGSYRLMLKLLTRSRAQLKGKGLELKLGVFPPLFHLAGYALAMLWVLGAQTLIFSESISSGRGFDPREALQVIQAHAPTIFFLVPSMWKKVLDPELLSEYDTRSLRIILTGAALAPGELKHQLLDAFPNAIIADVYGQTETSPVVSIRLDGDHREIQDRCIGKPLPGIEVKILDGAGYPLPSGGIGEIVIKGEIIMKQYYRDPERTRAKVRDGWLYTGDLGYLDPEGNLHILERVDETIITGGEKVYPLEVEQVIKSHPSVEEVCVIGVPDPEWGQAVRAVVKPKPGAQLDPKQIVDWCAQRMAGYKKPRSVILVESLPISPVGKLLRAQVKQLYGKLEPGS